MKLRLRCHLLGCECKNNYPSCDYCNTHYSDEWIETTRLQKFIWWVQRLFKEPLFSRCSECEKRIFRPFAYNESFCSEKCYDKWMPF
jgi:hypothetical protein